MDDVPAIPTPVEWSASRDIVASLVMKINEIILYVSNLRQACECQNAASSSTPAQGMSAYDERLAYLDDTLGILSQSVGAVNQRIAALESK